MQKQLAAIATLATIAAGLAAMGAAQAQLPVGNAGAQYQALTDTLVDPAAAADQYVDAAQQTMAAESGLLAAAGLQPEAEAVGAAGRGLQQLATRAELEEALKRQADAAQLLIRRLGGAQPLAADARTRFGQDVFALAQGIATSAEISKSLSANRRKIDMLKGPVVIRAAYLSKALPEHVRGLQQALKAAASYAAANGIVLPPEVAAAAG